MVNLNTNPKFINCGNYDFAQTESVMKEFLDYMRSDAYWLRYGGSFPYVEDGMELLVRYRVLLEEHEVNVCDSFIADYERQLELNSAKPDVQDRATTHTLPIELLSGSRIEIPLQDVTTFNDIRKHLRDALKARGIKFSRHINLINGQNVLEWNARIIVTDDTVLNVIFG